MIDVDSSQQRIFLEPLTIGDLDRVMQIDRASYSAPWKQTTYRTELRNRSATYLVARMSGDVVGYAGIWNIMDEAHITTIAVDQAYRRRHIGERLLVAILEEAVLKGAHYVTLEVRESNIPARALYEKYGFKVVAIRRNYYTDNNESALVMWAEDTDAEKYRHFLKTARQTLECEQIL